MDTHAYTCIRCCYIAMHAHAHAHRHWHGHIYTGIFPCFLATQVHVGSREFEHLRDYDMNALCARVVVVATRPGAGT
jgi:hypothetical protein